MAVQFGRYWLHEACGEGERCEVWRATLGPNPATFAFEVALKRLRPEWLKEAAQVDHFLAGAKLGRLLHHPHVVPIYESGFIEQRPYLVMELLRGAELATLLGRARELGTTVPPALAVWVALKLLRGLDYLHQAKDIGGVSLHLLHRQVNPAHIWLTLQGEVKLSGLRGAFVSGRNNLDEAVLVRSGADYLPPEAVRGDEPLDQAADVWGVAAVLYEMCTGQRPYADFAAHAGAERARPTALEPAYKLAPAVGRDLSRILAQALHPRPLKRPVDAADFYRLLKHHRLRAGWTDDAAALASYVQRDLGLGAAPAAAAAAAVAAGAGHSALGPDLDTLTALEEQFAAPDFAVPLEQTPTQRYQLAQQKRRGRRLVPWLVALVLVAAAGLFFGRAPGQRYLERWLSGWSRWQGHMRAAAPEAFAPGSSPSTTPPEAGAAGGPVAAAEPAAPTPPETAPRAAQRTVIDDSQWGPDLNRAVEKILKSRLAKASPAGTQRFQDLLVAGRKHLRAGQFAQAIAAYRAALAIRPDSPSALLGWARVLYEQGDYKKAQAMAQRVVALVPKDARAHFLLGNIFLASGQAEQARESYQRCVSQDSGPFAKMAQQILDAW